MILLRSRARHVKVNTRPVPEKDLSSFERILVPPSTETRRAIDFDEFEVYWKFHDLFRRKLIGSLNPQVC